MSQHFNRFMSLALFWVLFPQTISASDHADPIRLSHTEAGITGLFVFPDEANANLVIVLCTHPSLESPTSLPLEPLRYILHLDLDPALTFTEEDALNRYGGTVLSPTEIEADLEIRYQLSDDIELQNRRLVGRHASIKLPSAEVGIHDDPFIFHRFRSTNVVAIVQPIPFDQLPGDPKHFLVWATTERFGQQVDHAGRALRTMLPRFDFLNTLHPSQHVAAIRQQHEAPGVLQDVLSTFASPFFAIRHYDFAPDVVIYSRTRPAGYPNGRLLTDDVAKLCCEQGDCLLYEVSLADAHADHLPRPTTNPQGFQPDFPYLASANDRAIPPEEPKLRPRTIVVLALIGAGVAFLFILPWILLWKSHRQNLRQTS
ncbi:hypothetical protein [Rhodopirellula sp. P2]|uniref:hypothetical protein n=1 Tax=Rhodopirellula sp. P2 TaxID=2127060 RepID=UPI0023684BCC|nr:hypothetical protein [Rhodopirellula sp. P2]WDQ17178.1 hypothetical protein PSR62_01170 [Rhodopirellula sp. P2]